MLVLDKVNNDGIPVYFVAGSAAPASKAEKALKTSYELHGGQCFYCKKAAKDLTIDHAEPTAMKGSASIQNLLLACRACNLKKNHTPIEAFHPAAGREWLTALLHQVEERLRRLDAAAPAKQINPPSPPRPMPGGAGGP